MPENESLRFILEDEAGEEQEYEVIGTFTLGERDYIALLPVEDGEDGVKLLGFHAGEDDELLLDPIEDEEEYDEAAKAFEDIFNGNIPVDIFEEEPGEEAFEEDMEEEIEEDYLSEGVSEERENEDE